MWTMTDSSGTYGDTVTTLELVNVTAYWENTTSPPLVLRPRTSSAAVGVSEAIVPLYVVIFLLSVVGNALVIVTLVQNKRMRTVTNVYLLNLVSLLRISKLISEFGFLQEMLQYSPKNRGFTRLILNLCFPRKERWNLTLDLPKWWMVRLHHMTYYCSFFHAIIKQLKSCIKGYFNLFYQHIFLWWEFWYFLKAILVLMIDTIFFVADAELCVYSYTKIEIN